MPPRIYYGPMTPFNGALVVAPAGGTVLATTGPLIPLAAGTVGLELWAQTDTAAWVFDFQRLNAAAVVQESYRIRISTADFLQPIISFEYPITLNDSFRCLQVGAFGGTVQASIFAARVDGN